MRMTEIDYEDQRPIEGYGPGGFRIGGDWREGSLLLLPDGAIRRFAPPLTIEALSPLLTTPDPVDVLLVGMGEDIAPLPRALREALDAHGIGVEAMSTASACRTYNVLLTEARRVAAALVAL